MRILRSSILATVIATSAGAQAKDPRTVQPERPTEATHAGTVAPGYLELEWGARRNTNSTDIPLFFKLGLARRLQFGLALPFDEDGALKTVGLAVKFRLIDDAPVLGRFALQPQVNLPTKGSTTSVGLILISSHQLGPVAFDANVGFDSEVDGAKWMLSFGGAFSKTVGWVSELYGQAGSSTESDVALLAGPTFTIRNWFSLDAGAVVRKGAGASFFFGGVTNVGRIIRR